MPRHSRLNIPGAIYHVITRGIESAKIFRDDFDRKEFLRRIELGIKDTYCSCYAWSLMPNHFHLLIRTGPKSLSDLMRKVLTGYAIYFNWRHKRHGYLYQNRYKSILCQEDSYFLELVRYIHLNPLRAKLVANLGDLDRYPWSGHSVLVGKRKLNWQSRNEVLSRFSNKAGVAVQKYCEFIQDGLKMGKRDDLIGGGLRRSAGGWEGVKELKRNKDYWRGDERILGDGTFVNQILKLSEESVIKKERLRMEGWDIERLSRKVCKLMSINIKDLKKQGRVNSLSKAKSLIAYWGYYELGYSGVILSKYLGIARSSLSESIKRGERILKINNLSLTV